MVTATDVPGRRQRIPVEVLEFRRKPTTGVGSDAELFPTWGTFPHTAVR